MNTKVITKAQFNEMVYPTVDEKNPKNIESARLQLHPNNTGVINGNKYEIEVCEFEDKVVMRKIENV